MSAAIRYAIYWAPANDHPLWAAGCEWLGRDPESGKRQAVLRPLTSEPRRYGFHATLKAPMALRDGAAAGDLLEALDAIAARTQCFAMPELEVATLQNFVALCPKVAPASDHPLRRLADACVRDLDPLRRPLSALALQRRLQSEPLSAPKRELLDRWGYPHVFDTWRFHMTLSDAFVADAALRDAHVAEARAHFANALALPLRCESLAVFEEHAPGAPFMLVRRLPLAR